MLTNVPKPIKSALSRTLNDVHDFVQSDVSSGIVALNWEPIGEPPARDHGVGPAHP